MRILTGKYKGRQIQMPKGIRPTQNKVRKAIFDILGDIQGKSFLELFAGSAGVGIEALSQGASEVVLAEENRNCQLTIRNNMELLKAENYLLYPFDAIIAIGKLQKQDRRFDLIFFDPPYYRDLAKKTLQTLGACDILAPNGLIIVQHFKREALPEKAGNLVFLKSYAYGDTLLTVYGAEG